MPAGVVFTSEMNNVEARNDKRVWRYFDVVVAS